VREPSMRHYVRARELKAAGMDWTDVLAAEAENRWERLAAELLASAAYGRTEERVRAFVEKGGRMPGHLLQLPAQARRRGREEARAPIAVCMIGRVLSAWGP
jgi:hypothetical protein